MDHALSHGLGEHGVALLDPAPSLFGFLALGDIAVHADKADGQASRVLDGGA
jgi:hypothetical protein